MSPSRFTSRRFKSTSISPTCTMFSVLEEPTDRRSTARTRALSSSGLNGFAR